MKITWAALLWTSTWWAMPAAGQAFQGLATPNDGSILYFSSPDRQKGTDETFHSKIFRWDAAAGFQEVAEVRDPGTFDRCTTPNFYQLLAPQVSADGTVLAFTANRPTANGSRYCGINEPNQGIIQERAGTLKLPGNVAISPNGQYAVTTPLAALASDFHIVTELATGKSSVVAGAFNGSAQRVSNDGTVLTPEVAALILTDRTGGTRVFETHSAVNDAILDAAGDTAVYLTRLGPANPASISAIDIATGTETLLYTGFAPESLGMTNDGTTVFFTEVAAGTSGASSQLYSIGLGGSNMRQITHESDPIVSAVVSGNGAVAYALTGGSRLVRIDVTSGAVTELSPELPLITAAYVGYMQTTIVPVGSVVTLFGSGLAGLQQLSLCGQTVPVVAGQAQLQVPWTLPQQACQAIVDTSSSFEAEIDLTVQTYDPQFAAGGELLVHAGFTGLITSTSPAHPGETIVAYMTGLGPVNGNGEVDSGFHCSVDSVAAAVSYAGVAPGYIGFYQVNIQVPDVTVSSGTLVCGWDVSRQAATSLWLN